METVIKLYSAEECHAYTQRRQRLLQYLRGGKKVKELLKEEGPELYKYFETIWLIRNDHMYKELPTSYVFMLKCCGSKDCAHPLCKGKVYQFSIKSKYFLTFCQIVAKFCRRFSVFPDDGILIQASSRAS